MNAFNLKKSRESYYIEYDKKMPYSVSTLPLETDNPAELVAAILREFSHSSEAEKAQYKSILEEWLTEADDQVLFPSEEALLSKKPEEVLVNIYEMF